MFPTNVSIACFGGLRPMVRIKAPKAAPPDFKSPSRHADGRIFAYEKVSQEKTLHHLHKNAFFSLTVSSLPIHNVFLSFIY